MFQHEYRSQAEISRDAERRHQIATAVAERRAEVKRVRRERRTEARRAAVVARVA